MSGNKAVAISKPQPEEINKGFYAPITLYSGRIIINGGKIISNSGYHLGRAILALGDKVKSTIDINGGEIISNIVDNKSYFNYGGAIFAHTSVININSGIISKNSAEIGIGIYAENSEVNMKNGEISQGVPLSEKYARKGGGLALINSQFYLSGDSINNNRTYGYGGGIYLLNCKYKIDGGRFSYNSSGESGGALAAYNSSQGKINAGLFENNTSNGFYGGGTVYNDFNCELTINRALIKDNASKGRILTGANNKPVSHQGGGIWDCDTGHTIINITNGLALYDNLAPNIILHNGEELITSGDDFANITKYLYGEPVGKSSVKIASRMLGGGYRLWYQDGSTQGLHVNWPIDKQKPRYNPEKPGKPLTYNTVIEGKSALSLFTNQCLHKSQKTR